MPTIFRASLNCSGQLCRNVGQEVFSPALLIFLVHKEAHPSEPDRRLGLSQRPETAPEYPWNTELRKGGSTGEISELFGEISAVPGLICVLCSSVAITHNLLKLVANSPFCALLRF